MRNQKELPHQRAIGVLIGVWYANKIIPSQGWSKN